MSLNQEFRLRLEACFPFKDQISHHFLVREGLKQISQALKEIDRLMEQMRRDGSNLSSTTGGSEVAFLHSTGITSRNDEHSGKPPCKPIKEQDFWQDSLLDTGTTAAVRSRRFVEKKSKKERRKWNSNKPSETPTSINQEKTVWLVNKGNPRLRVKARRLSVIEEAEISSSIRVLLYERLRTWRIIVERRIFQDLSHWNMNIRVEVLPLRIFFRLVSCRCCGGLINLIIHEDTVSQLTHICGSRMALQKRLHVYTLITRVPKTNKLFSENAGRIPRPNEVAEIVGLSVENLSMVLQASKDPVSIDQPFRRGSYITHMHLVPDEDAETATEIFMRKLLREEMTKLIGSISPKEAEVLRYRYGF